MVPSRGALCAWAENGPMLTIRASMGRRNVEDDILKTFSCKLLSCRGH